MPAAVYYSTPFFFRPLKKMVFWQILPIMIFYTAATDMQRKRVREKVSDIVPTPGATVRTGTRDRHGGII